jgi:hypothetical protein
VRWEDVTLALPDGWVVHEHEPGRFAVTDAPLGTPDDPGPGEAGVFLVRDRSDTPDKWRALIERQGWTLEEDRSVTVGGAPATRLTFEQTDARVATRETVVLVPSRELTILLQPIPYGQDQDGPDIYTRHLEEFERILDGLAFGAARR